jgi:hypothetical protein
MKQLDLPKVRTLRHCFKSQFFIPLSIYIVYTTLSDEVQLIREIILFIHIFVLFDFPVLEKWRDVGYKGAIDAVEKSDVGDLSIVH